MTELGVNADTFLEIAILSGFDWIATFPPLQGNYSFKNAVDLATGANSVFAYAEDVYLILIPASSHADRIS